MQMLIFLIVCEIHDWSRSFQKQFGLNDNCKRFLNVREMLRAHTWYLGSQPLCQKRKRMKT